MVRELDLSLTSCDDIRTLVGLLLIAVRDTTGAVFLTVVISIERVVVVVVVVVVVEVVVVGGQ